VTRTVLASFDVVCRLLFERAQCGHHACACARCSRSFHPRFSNNNNRSAGAASGDSCGPSVRLLRGIKAAGGGDGARRLEALARRLPVERAALEAAAAAGAAEAREWRAAAASQASAVVSLGEVGVA